MNDFMNYGIRRTPQSWNDLDRLFHSFFGNYDLLEPEMFHEKVYGEPELECTIDDKNVTVVSAIPGCRPENISVEVNGNILTVQVKRERGAIEKEDARFIRRERTCSDYEGSVRIPAKVIGDQASAKYTDGVLTITIPREVREHKVHVVSVQ